MELDKHNQSLIGFLPQQFKAVRVVVDVGNGQVVPLVSSSEVGKALADLQGIEMDMDHVKECCDKYLELATSSEIENGEVKLLKKALLDSAVIRYRRCFGSGTRRKILHRQISDLSGVDVTLHSYFLAKADKYVAHSVNGLEVPIAAIIPGHDGKPTGGHLVVSFDFGDEAPDRLSAFRDLVSAVLSKIVLPEKSQLELSFENEVSSLTHEEVARLKPMSVPANHSANDLKKRR